MKKNFILAAIALALTACDNKQTETQTTVVENPKMTDCDFRMGE